MEEKKMKKMKKIFENVLDFLFEESDECVAEKGFFDEAKEMILECFSSPKMALLTLGALHLCFYFNCIYILVDSIFMQERSHWFCSSKKALLLFLVNMAKYCTTSFFSCQ